jgi:putative ABC transport system substrate-binding protein
MRRRDFITLLSGAAAVWPLAARAQQRGVPLIGVLHNGLRWNDDSWQAFRQGLRETGFVEGQNVAIEFRLAESSAEMQRLAGELVRQQVSVLFASPNAVAAGAAKDATKTIPIVFNTGPDPVRQGLVASLNRPGGNLTGVTQLSADLTVKRLGLLHECAPQAALVGGIFYGAGADQNFQQQAAEAAAKGLGLQIFGVSIGEENDFDTAFASLVRAGAQALLVATAVFFTDHRERLIAFAAKQKLPAIYQTRLYAEAGGLMSYGPSTTDLYRQAGIYTGRVLKGEKPADLPVTLPTKFEFIINLRTAKALGLAVPLPLLGLADEVIE